jgi:hypothetical protein
MRDWGKAWTPSMDSNCGHGRKLLLQTLAKKPAASTLTELKSNLNTMCFGSTSNEFLSTLPLTSRGQEYLEKLLANTMIQLSLLFPTSPCLYWKGAKDTVKVAGEEQPGYARHRPPPDLPGSNIVSRYVYQYLHGEPGELEVHHKCGVYSCINPDHLEALPSEENLHLGNPLQTYCQATWQTAA